MPDSKFYTNGSPLKGEKCPANWRDMDLLQKRQWLVEQGVALDLNDAASLLSQHGAAVRRARKNSAKVETQPVPRTGAPKLIHTRLTRKEGGA